MFSIYAYSLLDLVQQPASLNAAPSPSLKVIGSCKVLLSFFVRTSPSLTPLPYTMKKSFGSTGLCTSFAFKLCCGLMGDLWVCYCSVTHLNSVQFSSVAQSCPTLCDPMNCSTPGLPVHHHLLEFTQTHLHRVSDAIQPSHPLSSPSPPAPNPSQHQSLFQ